MVWDRMRLMLLVHVDMRIELLVWVAVVDHVCASWDVGYAEGSVVRSGWIMHYWLKAA